MTRIFESNGPDIKIRGTASHVAEKYVQLARDARSSGDPVAAENYYQHAEHYFRLIAAAQEQFRQNQPQLQPRGDDVASGDDGDDEGDGFSNFGQEPGFVPTQPQPYIREGGQREAGPREAGQREAGQREAGAREGGQREGGQREGQPFQREQQQPREHREREREHRPPPQYQPQPQPQPVVADAGGVDRLPSFITGPQPQINSGAATFEGGDRAERFPRRRRRPHGTRPEGLAPPAVPGDDFNPGNE